MNPSHDARKAAEEAAEAYAESVDAETGNEVSESSYVNGYLAGLAAAEKRASKMPEWVRTANHERRLELLNAGWKIATEVVQTETSTLWCLWIPPSLCKPPLSSSGAVR